MTTQKRHYKIPSAQDMHDFGSSCALMWPTGSVVFLEGQLGSGKTTWVRGFLYGLGWHTSVKSPTYSIMESYIVKTCTVHHFDLYRLHAHCTWDDLDGRDILDGSCIVLIEWPSPLLGIEPSFILSIHASENETRSVCIQSFGGHQEWSFLSQWDHQHEQ